MKSVTLNIQTKSRILSDFFRDVSKDAIQQLKSLENALALKVYQIIYSDLAERVADLPPLMFNHYNCIDIAGQHVRPKRQKRTKGKIQTSEHTFVKMRRLATWLSFERTKPARSINGIDLPSPMPQANVGRGDCHLENLVDAGFISKRDLENIERIYIKCVREMDKIIDPIENATLEVGAMLKTVRTTRQLREAWPECDNYLELPDHQAGAMITVNVADLNKNLEALYPPAKKSDVKS